MREKLNEWMLVGFAIAALLLFPLAGTTFHFLVRASLAKQQMLDTKGVPITARLVNKNIERNIHLDRRVGISQRGTRTEELCSVDVEYSVAESSAIYHQSTQLDDPRLCDRYRVGDTIPGRAMPRDPSIMLLDANRVGSHWFWISLFLMVAFIAGPIFAVYKLSWGKDKSAAVRKSDEYLAVQRAKSAPWDVEVRD